MAGKYLHEFGGDFGRLLAKMLVVTVLKDVDPAKRAVKATVQLDQ